VAGGGVFGASPAGWTTCRAILFLGRPIPATSFPPWARAHLFFQQEAGGPRSNYLEALSGAWGNHPCLGCAAHPHILPLKSRLHCRASTFAFLVFELYLQALSYAKTGQNVNTVASIASTSRHI